MNENSTPDALRPWSHAWYEAQKQHMGEAACRHVGFYVIPDDLRLSVVIPVYNEGETLRNLVDRVREVPVRKELVLVDDCSADNSREVMKALAEEAADDDFNQIRTFHHDVNKGKGAALRTGFANVSGDIVIIRTRISNTIPLSIHGYCDRLSKIVPTWFTAAVFWVTRLTECCTTGTMSAIAS